VSLTKVLGAYPVLRQWDHTLTLTLGHQHRTSDRAFEAYETGFVSRDDGRDALFGEDHLLSARLDYRIGDAQNEIAAMLEVGGSSEAFSERPGSPRFNANRLVLTATKTAGLGPFTGLARLALGVGSDRLSPQKWFRLGAASVETRWRSDAHRVLAAAPAAPQDDLHFFAFSGIGPVGYLRRDLLVPISPELLRLTRTTDVAFSNSLLAGSLALRSSLPRIAGLDRTWRAVLAPLQVEVFSGIGALNLYDFAFDHFVADAGFGVHYDVSALRLGRDLITQSDVLSELRLVAKFPVWVSDPEVIGPDEDAFGFRWLVGIETRL
jgi:hypothetical protein